MRLLYTALPRSLARAQADAEAGGRHGQGGIVALAQVLPLDELQLVAAEHLDADELDREGAQLLARTAPPAARAEPVARAVRAEAG